VYDKEAQKLAVRTKGSVTIMWLSHQPVFLPLGIYVDIISIIMIMKIPDYPTQFI